MKTIDVKMPQMGESAAEGTIVKWHKEMGDIVQTDEILVEIESDKINIEVESPACGCLSACTKAGRTVPVGEVIAIIETDEPEEETSVHAGNSDGDQVLVSTANMPSSLEASDIPESLSDWISPRVIRLAMESNITVNELKLINGTGKNNRITREDVLKFIGRRESAQASPKELSSTNTTDTVVPMSTIRRTIADHMVQSVRTSAHVTMVHKVDMTTIVKLRNLIKNAFLKHNNVRMSFTSVFTYIVARVLKDFPTMNASVVGSNIVLKNEINIGCAVALPDESLVVPVLKNADRKSFTEISIETAELIDRARSRALSHKDVTNGTFTISNFGSFGSITGTPLINQPQVAILGIGAVFEAPDVVNGKICIRDVTYLSLSFDHRVIDGAMGGRFLNEIQNKVETLSRKSLDLGKFE